MDKKEAINKVEEVMIEIRIALLSAKKKRQLSTFVHGQETEDDKTETDPKADLR